MQTTKPLSPALSLRNDSRIQANYGFSFPATSATKVLPMKRDTFKARFGALRLPALDDALKLPERVLKFVVVDAFKFSDPRTRNFPALDIPKFPILKENTVNGITLGYMGPNSEPIPMLEDELPLQTIPKGIQIVEWPVFKIAPKDIPLQTSGMHGCSAFEINSPNDSHYLMHYNLTSLNALQEHFNKDVPWLRDEKTELSLIPGTHPTTSDSVNAILHALYLIKPDLVRKVKFRHFPKEAAAYGPSHEVNNPVSVVSYQGKLFCHPVRAKQPIFGPGGDSIRPYITPMSY